MANFAQYTERLRQDGRPAKVTWVCGADRHLVGLAVQSCRAAFRSAFGDGATFYEMEYSDEDSWAQLADAIAVVPPLGAARMVAASGFVSGTSEKWDILDRFQRQTRDNPGMHVLLTSPDTKMQTTLRPLNVLKFKSNTAVVKCSKMAYDDAAQFVKGIYPQIAGEVLDALLEVSDCDGLTLNTGAQKLKLLSVTAPEHVRELVPSSGTRFVEALLECGWRAAAESSDSLEPWGLLSVLERLDSRLRAISEIRAGRSAGRRPSEVVDLSPPVLKKTLGLMDSGLYSEGEIGRRRRLLVAAEPYARRRLRLATDLLVSLW